MHKYLVNILPQKHTFADILREKFKRGSFFSQQSYHLSAHVQREFHHSSLFVIGDIEGVTTDPCCNCTWSPYGKLLTVLESSTGVK